LIDEKKRLRRGGPVLMCKDFRWITKRKVMDGADNWLMYNCIRKKLLVLTPAKLHFAFVTLFAKRQKTRQKQNVA